MSKRPSLGERELDIMLELWQRHSATVTEVHRALTAKRIAIAYNTVQTMLNRLESKGIVARNASDRAHRYSPLLAQQAFVGRAIHRLTLRFFGGSAEALAVRLVEDQLDTEQLERLRELIDKSRRSRR